jgi:hypothetical protein
MFDSLEKEYVVELFLKKAYPKSIKINIFPHNAILVLFKGVKIKINMKKIESVTNKHIFFEFFT